MKCLKYVLKIYLRLLFDKTKWYLATSCFFHVGLRTGSIYIVVLSSLLYLKLINEVTSWNFWLNLIIL